jgi:hypothetical protein
MITASSLGDTRTALTFLNRPRVVARFSGLMQMWAWPRKTEEASPQIRNGGVDGRNPLRNGMSATPLPARIAGIYRYPVKGLSPEPLGRAELTSGQTLVADRRYAIENGPSGFDPGMPKWLPKPHFLMLMRDEWLAGLGTRFDDASHILSIHHNGRIAAQGDLRTPEGRRTIENFFASTFAGQIKGPPKLLESPGHSFSDVARKVVSIINLASVRAIEGIVGAPVASAPTSMSRAGRPGTSSICSTGRSRSATPDSRW